MTLLRDLGRRKLRTSLTILGITIGIWALVVFGSMANKIDALVAGGSEFYQGKLTVSAKGGSMGFGNPLDMATADRIAGLPGVDVAVPGVAMLLSNEASTVSFGTPDMIQGQVGGGDRGRETFVLQHAQGRGLSAADEGTTVTVLGSDLARKLGVRVGDTVTIGAGQ